MHKNYLFNGSTWAMMQKFFLTMAVETEASIWPIMNKVIPKQEKEILGI